MLQLSRNHPIRISVSLCVTFEYNPYPMITSLDQLDLDKRYTYADYLTWQFEEQVELIRGRIFKTYPTPNTAHQRVSINLAVELGIFFRSHSCQLFAAPFDVRLPLPPEKQTPDKLDTVVQPDLCVICNLEKLDEQGCEGAPDLIIEILSPATSSKDLNEKFELYQHTGVREYWVVHPNDGTLLIYHLDNTDSYKLLRQRPYTSPEKVASFVFPELLVKLEEVF